MENHSKMTNRILKHHIDLNSAVELIREFEPILANHGIHVALTGSVLFKGRSQKDFDIYLYPRDPKKSKSINEVRTILIYLGFNVLRHESGSGTQYNKKTGIFSPSGGTSSDKRIVDIMEYKGYRVDVFLDAFQKSLPTKEIEQTAVKDEDVPF